MTATEDTEFFRLPDPEDQEYWERAIAAGLHQPAGYGQRTVNGTQPAEDSWQRIDLLADNLKHPPEPPAIHGLLYRAKRHVISGPPESAKTLVAYILLLEALRQGHGIAIIDLEMGAYAAVTMLRELGATDQEIASILYFEPQEEPYDELAQHLTIHGTRFVLIDAAAGAYDIAGLDDNRRQDVEQFATRWIRPLWHAGISTIVVDHVTKNTETRGKFAIGSERKGGQADVHLGLDAIKTLSRGTTGLIKITAHKDRPGWLDRPTVCYFELQSDPATHHIAWQIKPHDHADPDTGEMRPTVLMERVSEYLERQAEPASRKQVETTVKGKSAEWLRKAMDCLIREGYATEETGSRGARNLTSTRPYRRATDPLETTSSDLVSTSSGRGDLTSSDPVPPHGGRDEVNAPETTNLVQTRSSEIDLYDPAIQELLDDDGIPF